MVPGVQGLNGGSQKLFEKQFFEAPKATPQQALIPNCWLFITFLLTNFSTKSQFLQKKSRIFLFDTLFIYNAPSKPFQEKIRFIIKTLIFVIPIEADQNFSSG